MRRNIYLFLGPPGAGKGSLASLCVRNFGWVQCSTGNLCRQHITDNTDIGRQIAFSIKSGKLIEDDLIVKMVTAWLAEQVEDNRSVILDGFPRTTVQAHVLDELLKSPALASSKLVVVQIKLSDEVVVQRLTKRIVCANRDCQAVYAHNDAFLAPKQDGICDQCSCELIRRSDDAENSVIERLKMYRLYAQDLLGYYYNRGAAVMELGADEPLEQVFRVFKKLIGIENA